MNHKNWKQEFNNFVISESTDGSHLIEGFEKVKEEIEIGLEMASKIKDDLRVQLEEIENALVFIKNKK